MAFISEDFLNSVVAIGLVDKNKKKHWIGTGFVYAYFKKKVSDTQRNYAFYIVTNKHVIQSKDSIIIRFNPVDNSPAKDFTVRLTKGNSKNWTGHHDSNIDVAVINFNIKLVQEQGMKVGYFRSEDHTLESNQMKERGIFEGNYVYALGYPMGMVNTDRQYVIVRNGSIARIRDLYDNRSKEYIIDAFVFPGNSGGPVLSQPIINSKNPTTNLIGIVKSYVAYKDVAVSKQTGRSRMVFEENTGLTTVIPVNYINETIALDIQNKNTQSKENS